MSIGFDPTNPLLSTVMNGASPVAPAARLDSLGHSLSVRNFEDMLRVANGPAKPELLLAQADATQPATGATATDAVNPLIPTTGTPPVDGASASAETDARLRAAEGLGLASGEDVGPGNSILNGLEQLRSVFDNEYVSVGKGMEGPILDANAMIALQADMVEYSVLVDVTSKLAGKVTTAIDSLMKGQ